MGELEADSEWDSVSEAEAEWLSVTRVAVLPLAVSELVRLSVGTLDGDWVGVAVASVAAVFEMESANVLLETWSESVRTADKRVAVGAGLGELLVTWLLGVAMEVDSDWELVGKGVDWDADSDVFDVLVSDVADGVEPKEPPAEGVGRVKRSDLVVAVGSADVSAEALV